MKPLSSSIACIALVSLAADLERSALAAIPVDVSRYSRECGVAVDVTQERVVATWPAGGEARGRLAIDLRPSQPRLERLEVSSQAQGDFATLLGGCDPAYFFTVGTREVPPGKPPDQTWAVFFDSPASRKHEVFRSSLELTQAGVRSSGRRATVRLEKLSAGPFSGALEITLYAGSPLVHLEAVVATAEDRRAYFYDAGLLGESTGLASFAWIDTAGRLQRQRFEGEIAFRPLAVRHRTLVGEGPAGSVAVFPPPHSYFFPRDLTDNLRYVWLGRGCHDLTRGFGFGVRQEKTGGGSFVPWFNAPPGTEQRCGVWLLVTGGGAEEALREVLAYTRGDRFEPLSGHLTLTSHWHMAVAVSAMKAKEGLRPGEAPPVPEFVRIFKDLGVDMVHLADFHGDGHQFDPGPLRLPELEALFEECRRLSDERLLLIPGEEVNTYLGLAQPGRHPGHWMSLFPKPLYWILKRAEGEPFVSEHPRYGRVYRVGSREDVVKLLEAEQGLVWAAHPRIKASSWTPDVFRREDFYVAGSWLGAAWKAMPADLSEPRLGWRPLELLDDMARWGQRKYLVGEVDVFKIDSTHELYGHMNVNYLRLERLPRFDEGWKSVLDALRGGRFFVTTGEVLIPRFRAGGRESGETVKLGGARSVEVEAEVAWTFPLAFAELVRGEGETVRRQRVDLSDTEAFGKRELAFSAEMGGRGWLRLEVWDAARNGAFTQLVWVEP
jgi:hypothetical protein